MPSFALRALLLPPLLWLAGCSAQPDPERVERALEQAGQVSVGRTLIVGRGERGFDLDPVPQAGDLAYLILLSLLIGGVLWMAAEVLKKGREEHGGWGALLTSSAGRQHSAASGALLAVSALLGLVMVSSTRHPEVRLDLPGKRLVYQQTFLFGGVHLGEARSVPLSEVKLRVRHSEWRDTDSEDEGLRGHWSLEAVVAGDDLPLVVGSLADQAQLDVQALQQVFSEACHLQTLKEVKDFSAR